VTKGAATEGGGGEAAGVNLGGSGFGWGRGSGFVGTVKVLTVLGAV
jgi:hypothetical protein